MLCNNSQLLKSVNYYCEKLYLRCFVGVYEYMLWNDSGFTYWPTFPQRIFSIAFASGECGLYIWYCQVKFTQCKWKCIGIAKIYLFQGCKDRCWDNYVLYKMTVLWFSKSSKMQKQSSRGVLLEIRFLEISNNSQENTCTTVSFLETLTQVFSCEFCEISKNIFLHKTPLVAASELYSQKLLF